MNKTELQMYFKDQEIAELLEDAVKLHAFIACHTADFGDGNVEKVDPPEIVHWNIDGANIMGLMRERFPNTDVRLLFIYEGGETAAIDWYTGYSVRDTVKVADIEDRRGHYTLGQVEDGRFFVLYEPDDETPVQAGDTIDSFDCGDLRLAGYSWLRFGLYDDMQKLYDERATSKGYPVST